MLWGRMGEALDLEMMQRALELARAAAASGEAPIGAVIAEEASGAVVAEAHNKPISLRDPTGHAEILAMRAAATKLGNYRLPGLTLYVTLEPCAMCAGAISHARLQRLVFGAPDEKGGAVVNGVRFFDQPSCHSRPAVSRGLLTEESSALLKHFFRARR